MSEWTEERLARAALTRVCGAGEAQLAKLVAEVGAVAAWEQVCAGAGEPRWAVRAAACEPERIAETAEQHGIRFMIPGDSEWPTALDVLDTSPAAVKDLGGAPVGLWARGPVSPADIGRRGVAIVGARAATRYGELVAGELSAELADSPVGFTVISGGAYGIDAAAHRGALGVGGNTVGVYSQGLDLVYPQGNRRLYEQLCAEQVVLSEVSPGTPPMRHAFLARNRIIAALSLGTIVVEAALRSGARNTANWATLIGRVLMAVPGPVTSATSVTPNRLIRDGEAALVATASDVLALLADLGTIPESSFYSVPRDLDLLPPEQQALCEVLPIRGTRTPAELSVLSGLPIPKLQATLTTLELLGLATPTATGWRLARSPQTPNRDIDM